MSKTILAAVLVFFVAGGALALLKGETLIGIGMIAFAAIVLPTLSAVVWMLENKRKKDKN